MGKDYGWKRDPSVKRERFRGKGAPEGHVRRCQGRRTRDGLQCSHWALRGRSYCKFHGGKLPLSNGKSMSRYYSKNSGPLLKEKLLELSADGRMSLTEEVDIARVTVLEYLASYEATVLDPNNKASAKLKTLAATGLRQAIDHVADIVSKAARVQDLVGGSISIEQLDYFVVQIVKVLNDKLPTIMRDDVIKAVQNVRLPETQRKQADPKAVASEMRAQAKAMKEMRQ